jgi:hypothetical protein
MANIFNKRVRDLSFRFKYKLPLIIYNFKAKGLFLIGILF